MVVADVVVTLLVVVVDEVVVILLVGVALVVVVANEVVVTVADVVVTSLVVVALVVVVVDEVVVTLLVVIDLVVETAGNVTEFYGSTILKGITPMRGNWFMLSANKVSSEASPSTGREAKPSWSLRRIYTSAFLGQVMETSASFQRVFSYINSTPFFT